MIVEFEPSPLFQRVNGLIENLGFSVVEVGAKINPNEVKVHIVIHRESGVDLEGCAKVSRAVMTSLEDFFDRRDVSLEVSSPGLERSLKTWREFEIFRGLPGKIIRSGGDWESVSLGPDLIGQDIVKARLDLLGEVD